MKFLFATALIAFSAPSFAEVGRDPEKEEFRPAEDLQITGKPVETVRVTDQEIDDLFVRVRGAHTRAIQDGKLTIGQG
ncbi:MAG TPA: hypothetical protein VIH99_03745 [Bdellovibrionota bacterium]